MIFDSHAHYDDKAFDQDRESLLCSLKEKGIGRVVNISSDLESIGRTEALTGQYPFLYGAAGVHPSDTGALTEENFSRIGEAFRNPKMVAVGEIGLDYHWAEKRLPVVIHSREAARDTLDMIRAAGGSELSAVIHCFSYGVEMAREYLNMGHYLGIGGVVTFANAKKLKEVVQYMPLSQMLLETDCPYLAPVPYRGKRNDSANLSYVAETVAQLKGISREEAEAVTYENACRFYRLEEA